MNIVYITQEWMGAEATEADVVSMIAMLREKGWDARAGVGRSEIDEEENPKIRESFNRDFAACLNRIA